ncbi:MAG: methyltransferase domain-containing protein [Candidatus Baltobacteraceae bacterium]
MSRDRALRENLVSYLRRVGSLHDSTVAQAFLDVPRHPFIPGVSLETAYEDRALAIKEHDGTVISSISQPGMIAQMLELLSVRPGARILEIGTGSGYNAALLATLAGASGSVVSIELEEDLAAGARALFSELGFANIDVRRGDAQTIALDGNFDRMIATVRADDIPDVWWDALADDARIVVPLDIAYGGERVVAFTRRGNRLHATQTQACSFIGIRSGKEKLHGDIFFRNTALRYAPEPGARAPLQIVAMRRRDVRPEFLEHADVVVARPHTLFAVSVPSQSRGMR